MPIEAILIPTDFSENAQLAFEEAYRLAKQLGARLIVLHVQNESTLRTAVKEGLLRADSTDDDLAHEVRQLIESRFSAMLAGIDRAAVRVETMTRRGDADAEIVACAEAAHAGFIVMGTRGKTPGNILRAALLGSVAEAVARKAPCPVMIVQSQQGEESHPLP